MPSHYQDEHNPRSPKWYLWQSYYSETLLEFPVTQNNFDYVQHAENYANHQSDRRLNFHTWAAIGGQEQCFQESCSPPSIGLAKLENSTDKEEPHVASSLDETASSCESSLYDFIPQVSLGLAFLDAKVSAPVLVATESSISALSQHPAEEPKNFPVKRHKRKQIMSRSKRGCWICRIKHLKCDEIKPICKNCNRFGIQCDYSEERPAYVLDKDLRRQKLDTVITKKRRRTVTRTTKTEELVFRPQDHETGIGSESHGLKHEWFPTYLSNH